MTMAKTTKRFGNSATLARFPDAKQGDSVNPRYVGMMFDEFWQRVIVTLDRWSERQGGRDDGMAVKLAHPTIAIALDDKAIYMDLIAEVVPASEGLDWYANRFRMPDLKANLGRAVQIAANKWAVNDWDGALVVTEEGISEASEKP